MAKELEKMSAKELRKHQADVEKALAKAQDRDFKAAKAAAEKAAAEHGFALADLVVAGKSRAKGKGKPKAAAPAKYKNPADPSQTWSGRGRRPKWFADAQDAGKDMSKFEI